MRAEGRRGVEIQSKHKHRDVTGEHECQTNRNPNVQLQIIDIRHKPKLDKTQILTLFSELGAQCHTQSRLRSYGNPAAVRVNRL